MRKKETSRGNLKTAPFQRAASLSLSFTTTEYPKYTPLRVYNFPSVFCSMHFVGRFLLMRGGLRRGRKKVFFAYKDRFTATAQETAKICPFLQKEPVVCCVKTASESGSCAPDRIKREEFCTTERFTLCYTYFTNKAPQNS